MRFAEVVEIQERLGRHIRMLAKKTGDGVDQTIEVPDYGPTRYIFPGIPSHDEFADRLRNAIHWSYAIKDHVKAFFVANGGDKQVVENYVNAHQALKLCADLDNLDKHAKLTTERAGIGAHLGTCRIETDDMIRHPDTLRWLVRGVGLLAAEITPERAHYFMPILDTNEIEVADAGETVRHAAQLWDQLLGFVGAKS